MNSSPNERRSERSNRPAAGVAGRTLDLSGSLSWINTLKGLAIIGVFLENWTNYMTFATSPAWLYALGRLVSLASGPFVQVFFILSGFGLTVAYYNRRDDWHWGRWAWRRITKVIVPYEIAVVLTLALGLIGARLYPADALPVPLRSFLANALLLRNFYPPSWHWNLPFWFMPVIAGLYLSFPLLIKLLDRFGPWALLAISIPISFGTLAAALATGLYAGHGSDVFSYWVFQFALGMVLAHLRRTRPQRLQALTGTKPLLAGVALVLCSYALRTYVPLGNVFNDALTSVGIFLVLLNAVAIGQARLPAANRALGALGEQSFAMYLIHYAILQFLIGPPLRTPTNPAVVIALGLAYVGAVFLLSKPLFRPVDRLVERLGHLFPARPALAKVRNEPPQR